MKITMIRMVLQDRQTRFVGLGSIVIDEVFLVDRIKILTSQTGLYIGMPSFTKSDGTHQDIAHPLTPATSEALKTLLIDAYSYCAENGVNDASFLLEDGFVGSLEDQRFKNFRMQSSYDASGKAAWQVRREEISNDAFKKWLYS